MPNEYENYYNNSYVYMNFEKEFKNFNLNIRKEPEKNITTEYVFIKFHIGFHNKSAANSRLTRLQIL